MNSFAQILTNIVGIYNRVETVINHTALKRVNAEKTGGLG